jgi:thymidylate synthase
MREPMPFPKLRLLRKASSIDDFVIDDFEVSGYESHARISAPVAV